VGYWILLGMKKSFIYIILTSLVIISCQKILFNEESKTREIFLKDFHAVKISGIYNIVLIQDSTNRLVITGKNNINTIEAQVNNDTLIIINNKKLSFNTEKNTLSIHFSNLENMVTYNPVNVSNRGTIKANHFRYGAIGEIAEVRLKINCNYLFVVNSANTLGYFNFTGTADSCMLFNRYGSSIFADSLVCKNAEIYNESVGDVYINASAKIRAYIWGPGNIYYYGTPVIKIAEKRGTGNIIKAVN
jgi:hypothetical protein